MHLKVYIFLILNLSLCLFGGQLRTTDVFPIITELLDRHISEPKLTPQLFRKAMEAYIKYWDPDRILIMKEELPNILKDFEKIRTSNFTDFAPLIKFHEFLVNRRKYLEDISAQQLGSSYKLNQSAEREMDPKLTRFPSLDEIQSRIHSLIHFEVAYGLSEGLSLENAKEKVKKRLANQTKKMENLSTSEILVSFINAFTSSLDPYSQYFTEQQVQEFKNEISLTVEGIGIEGRNTERGFIITNIIKGGGAEESGALKLMDTLIAVRGSDGTLIHAEELSPNEFLRLIRGKSGTKVNVVVQRKGPSLEVFETSIVRKRIDVESGHASIRYEDRVLNGVSRKIGIINIPSFYKSKDSKGTSLTSDMIKLLNEAKAQKIEGLILDVSNNPGGLLPEAISTASLFIGEKPVLISKFPRGEYRTHRTQVPEILYDGPLVVLTSPASASASEVLAGLLKDYSRAIIVGSTQTYGKGTIQVVESEINGPGALKVTEGMFFLPKGNTTQHSGVRSDIVLPNPIPNANHMGEAHFENALAPQQMDSFFPRHHSPVEGLHPNPNLIARLSPLSQKRVAESPHFQNLIVQAEAARNRPSKMTVAEFLKNRAEKTELKSENDHPEDNFSQLRNEGINVIADWINPLPQERCMNAWRKIGS